MTQPIYGRFRIENLENHIGRTIAKGQDEAGAALRYFARTTGVNLNETKIQQHADVYAKELALWKKQDEERAAKA